MQNSHENVQSMDTLYLYEDEKGEIYDSTYNCKWSVSKVDDSFAPASSGFVDYSKPVEGKITIPSYAIYKNRKYTLRNLTYYNILQKEFTNITIDSSDNGITFTAETATDTNCVICLKHNFFNISGYSLVYKTTDTNKLYSDPTCKNEITENDKKCNVVYDLNGSTLTKYLSPQHDYIYIKADTNKNINLPKCYSLYNSLTVDELKKHYMNKSTKLINMIEFTCVDTSISDYIQINVNMIREIIFSKNYNTSLRLYNSYNNSGLIEIIYPKFNFVSGYIRILSNLDDGNTKISLHVSENYKECGLGENIVAKNNDAIYHLWLSYLFFNGEDIKNKASKYFGDFSSFSTNLKCIHLPKQYLDLTGTTESTFITYLKSLFNVNCSIAFY